jgi:hypothetical protein
MEMSKKHLKTSSPVPSPKAATIILDCIDNPYGSGLFTRCGKRSLCKNIEYPAFGYPEPVILPDELPEQMTEFSPRLCMTAILIFPNRFFFVPLKQPISSLGIVRNCPLRGTAGAG